MTEDQVMDKRNTAAIHYWGLLHDGKITREDYFYFMRDLTRWTEGKFAAAWQAQVENRSQRSKKATKSSIRLKRGQVVPTKAIK
jgi:hypothetical protein